MVVAVVVVVLGLNPSPDLSIRCSVRGVLSHRLLDESVSCENDVMMKPPAQSFLIFKACFVSYESFY